MSDTQQPKRQTTVRQILKDDYGYSTLQEAANANDTDVIDRIEMLLAHRGWDDVITMQENADGYDEIVSTPINQPATFATALQHWVAAVINHYPHPGTGPDNELTNRDICAVAHAMCPDYCLMENTPNLVIVFPDDSRVEFPA